MKKALVGTLLLCGFIGLGLAGMAMGNGALVSDEAPAMMVSPQMIVLDKVTTVTVHTNILASLVASDTLTLDEASPVPGGVWVDDCGHIVARFAVADLDLTPGKVTLTLTGLYEDGGDFAATDVVKVK